MANPTTLADAKTQYLANADYADGAGDVVKARAFRTACIALAVLMPENASDGPHAVSMNAKAIAAAADKVEDWLANRDPAQTSGRGGAIAISRRRAR